MAMKTVQLNTATIGPESWRNASLKAIKLSQNIVGRSDKACDLGRSMDPVPQLRDTVGQLSNDEIHRYVRETRVVVAKLRESMLDTNEEIKMLTRGKEALEKALEHKRKDIKLNRESSDIRVSRPAREKDIDGADDLLGAERMHLLNLKRMLEAQLKLVQQQLQVLDVARKRLAATIQERSRVLDLVCHALSSVANTTVQHTNNGRMSVNGYMGSTPLPPRVDPIGPFTPEAEISLNEASDARNRSGMLRRELKDLIDRTEQLQQSAHKSVNDGLTRKIGETATLKQHLQVGAGENRHSIHRAQRWYDATERAWGYTRGPVTTSDLTTRERLDRPLVKIYQRHPGTQLPEAQLIVKGGDGLLDSLTATSRNIGLLKLAQLKLKEDIRDKKSAMDVDSSIYRLRRRKANHRWVMGEAF
ncbi:coiled-coil domain-containing protein 105 [Lingula anatina]|uniref:Coiled-coil domain-containing protein 105 n=1 Tax=Lingula anatina TaxID=7574 RepID=A0A1S3HXT4_LINAN|nr:coiled-coil domain-containing protein 105 [Lingula anatina]|eukprot:XP_013390840.1 coiled-coil domain-containing protein 105 [Lingula anatina]